MTFVNFNLKYVDLIILNLHVEKKRISTEIYSTKAPTTFGHSKCKKTLTKKCPHTMQDRRQNISEAKNASYESGTQTTAHEHCISGSLFTFSPSSNNFTKVANQ